jgi:hypothetical protein
MNGLRVGDFALLRLALLLAVAAQRHSAWPGVQAQYRSRDVDQQFRWLTLLPNAFRQQRGVGGHTAVQHGDVEWSPCCDRCFKLREEVLVQRLNAFAVRTNSIRIFNQSGLVIDLDQRFQIE